MSKATIKETIVSIPTYKLAKPEKSPLFIEKRAYQGSTGKVYPLPVTEKIYDEKGERQYKALILENEYIYVMILPELGGRIQRAYDKTNGYDFVYYNHVIKPALVGLAGPWISGGIEFNWPQHHRPSTFSPVDYSYSENEDGSVTAYVGETDRMYGTKSVASITVYPKKAYIEIKGQIYNPTDFPQTFLWWANPAVSVNDDTYSVFPPDVNAVMDHGKRAVSTFPIATGEYYKVDYSKGVDISRYKNIKVPTSYMAAHSDFDFIGNFDEGKNAGLLHIADHHISPGKKQWTWGNGDFGKKWDKNLTDEDGPYIELMTGVYTDNQPDFTWLKPNEEKTFTQYFMPYKAVGRVSNATKDIVIGVNENEIKVYATGEFKNANISIISNSAEIYSKNVDLSPEECFIDTVDNLDDYVIRVEHNGRVLCEHKKFVPDEIPIPDPADELKAPKDIDSLEELFLAGQHLEQYRHATRNPADYYLEGLTRDNTDIRLNNAYGLLLLRNGLIEKSIPYFKAAIKKQTWRNPNPYNGETFYNLGVAYELVGDLGNAYDSFFKATWSAETQSNAFFHLACISCKKGDKELALEFLDKCLIGNYHNMKARALKAELMSDNDAFLSESFEIDRLCFPILYQYLDKEDFVKAMGGRLVNYLKLSLDYIQFGLYEKAIDILNLCSAQSPLVEYYKGYSYSLLNDDKNAVSHFEKGEKLSSDYCFPNSIYEMLILEKAIDMIDKSPMANYYLGNLLYDKKQYDRAVKCWEYTAENKKDFALAYRNLSIAYYNKKNDIEKALAAIKTACELEPDNSRFLLEQDQLFAKANISCEERLAVLNQHKDLIEDRDTLCLSYVTLLNKNGCFEEALRILERHVFHVWEGGEGKVAEQYKISLFALAEKELSNNNFEKAIALAEKTINYPDNFGEGKLFNVPDNRAHYIIGKCYKALGKNDEANKYFNLASVGSTEPEPVRYYNDQPSDYIYYIGLAYLELGCKEKARKAFDNLADFGKKHIDDAVDYDFFAVSLPELEVYQDDIQKRNYDYCKMLIELGEKGISLSK